MRHGPQNCKFYEILGFKCPVGPHPLRDSYEIFSFVGIQLRFIVWIWSVSLKGFRCCGVYVGGAFSLKFSQNPSGESIDWFEKVKEVQKWYESVTTAITVGLDLILSAGAAIKFFVFLSVVSYHIVSYTTGWLFRTKFPTNRWRGWYVSPNYYTNSVKVATFWPRKGNMTYQFKMKFDREEQNISTVLCGVKWCG